MGFSGETNPSRSGTQDFEPFDDSDGEGMRNGHNNANNIGGQAFSSDSDDSEGPADPDTEGDVNIVTRGYVMVNWESENENEAEDDDSDSAEPQIPERATDALQLNECSEDSVEEHGASGDSTRLAAAPLIILNETQADLIKNIMTKISLPATAFPPWATAVSDEELKNIASQLVEKNKK